MNWTYTILMRNILLNNDTEQNYSVTRIIFHETIFSWNFHPIENNCLPPMSSDVFFSDTPDTPPND